MPDDDHRLFVGNLSKDVTDEILAQHFAHYSSLIKTRVVRDKYTKGPKGYGFVSFLDVTDFSRALKEMEGTYIINRPCKLSQSTWNDRTSAVVKNGKLKRREDAELDLIFHQLEMSCSDKKMRRRKNYHIKGVPNYVFASDLHNPR